MTRIYPPCPLCHGVLEHVSAFADGGMIAEPIMGRRRDRSDTGRLAIRPASFFACTACEWCAETTDSNQEAA